MVAPGLVDFWQTLKATTELTRRLDHKECDSVLQ